jgi:hypothetical protein
LIQVLTGNLNICVDAESYGKGASLLISEKMLFRLHEIEESSRRGEV